MKEANFFKRLSAITLAAAITAANVGFDFLPSAKKAAAEPKEENSVTEAKTPEIMTQKSKYPTALSLVVEKNDNGESVLRASDPAVFNKYFTAELISLDAPAEGEEPEQAEFSADGTVIRKGGHYTVNIRARINEETGELVYNPYRIIGSEIAIADSADVSDSETADQEIAVIEDAAAEEPVQTEIEEIPVITETSLNICESDVNAAVGMFDMSQSQKLYYTVVKAQDSYNVMIPDDYDELFLNGIDEEGNAFFNAAGEEVQVNFNEVEMNIQIANFAELKVKDFAEPAEYSVERFCGEEALPYYYGEIVKVTPASGYNIVINDMKFSDAVSVAINDDAVTPEQVAINVYEGENRSQNFTCTTENGVATVQPAEGKLNGMKYTLSVESGDNVRQENGRPLTFSLDEFKPENGNVRVDASGIEPAVFQGLSKESEEITFSRPTEPLINFVNGTATDNTWYPNGKLIGAKLSFLAKSVKINNVSIKSTTGKLYAAYDAAGKLTGGDNSIISEDASVSKGQWQFFINPEGVNNLHEDLYLDVDYTPVKEIKFTLGVEPPKNDANVIGKLNGTEFKDVNNENIDGILQSDANPNDNTVTFTTDDKWKITKVKYNNNDISPENGRYKIGSDAKVKELGKHEFVVTLERKKVKVNVTGEFSKLHSLSVNSKTITEQTTINDIDAGTISFVVYPKVGYYVNSITRIDETTKKETIVYSAGDENKENKEFNLYGHGEISLNDECLQNATYDINVVEVDEAENIEPKIDLDENYYEQNGKEFTIISGVEKYNISFVDRLFYDVGQSEKNYTNAIETSEKKLNPDAEETFIYYFVNGKKIEKVTVKISPQGDTPEITGFTVKKSSAYKILNILSFGIFSNDKIDITVYAKSTNNNFNISNIQLFNNGENIDPNENVELHQENDGTGIAYKTFTLTKSESPYNLTAQAFSKFSENTKECPSPVYTINVDKNEIGEVKPISVPVVNENGEYIEPKPIIIESKVPTVELRAVEPIVINDEKWYNDDAYISVNAKDSASGVNRVEYSINEGETQTLSCEHNEICKDHNWEKGIKINKMDGVHTYTVTARAVDNAGNKNDKEASVTVNIDAAPPVIDNVEAYIVDDENNEIKYTGQWTNKKVHIDFTVTDEGSGVNRETVKVNGNKPEYDPAKGMYYYTVSENFSGSITINAEDNVGNPADEKSFEVHTEKTNPDIEDIIITDEYGNFITPNEDLEYKYIFNLPAKVNVVAKDTGTIQSGVNSDVGLRLIWEDGTIWQTLTPTSVENGVAYFDLPSSIEDHYSFDGHIEVMAVDNAGNKTLNEATNSEWIPHELLIAENPESHAYHSSAEIILPETPYRDNNGNPLYKDANSVTFRVSDSASGIKSITYTIDGGDEIKVDPNDWYHESKRNVATFAEGTISIPNIEKNGIKITLTAYDYAGNPIGIYEDNEYKGPVEQTISIDKTAPDISVTFNPAGSANQEFFNKQRTATVIAKDRNLRLDNLKELIDVTITNALGTSAAPYKITKDWTLDKNIKEVAGKPVEAGEEVYKCEITFVQDAEYTFALSVEDLTKQFKKSDTYKFTIDTTAPKLSITFDNNSKANDKYYNAGRKATLTINEHNFAKNKDSVKSVLSAKGADGITAMDSKEIYDGKLTWTQSKTNKDEWTAQVNFNKEGTFDFSMAYTDPAGNNGNNADSGEFIIDTTAPTIDHTFTKGGNKLATDGDFVPHVVFSDYNFLSENQIGNNCKVTISKIGENGLSSESFSSTSRSYTSKRADSPVTFEQVFDIFDDKVEVDGIYEIAVKAEDLAGNVTEINDITVSVNRFGPTYMIVNEEAKEAVKKFSVSGIPINEEIDFEIAEINVTPKKSKSKITVTVGESINELKDGFKTSEDRVSLEEGSWESNENGWYQTSYKIDKKNFANDGVYMITLDSEYEEKSYNSEIARSPRTKLAASFSVDKTAPSVIISGADEGEYKESEIDLTVTFSDRNLYEIDELNYNADNEDQSTFYIKINDKPHNISTLKSQYGAEITKNESGNIVINFTVKADGKNSKQVVSAFIKDKAGNSSDIESKDCTVRFTLLVTNNWLMIIIIAASVLILGTAVFFVTKKVRNR